MANKVFNSIEEMMHYVEKAIAEVLWTEVNDYIIHRLRESAQENVYDVYPEPRRYVRRHNEGGLIDERNFESNIKLGDEIILEIYNVAEKNFQDGDMRTLAESIEYGMPNGTQIFELPRPFIQPIVKELMNSDIIEEILKDNLDF
jgi:hypothetical protein